MTAAPKSPPPQRLFGGHWLELAQAQRAWAVMQAVRANHYDADIADITDDAEQLLGWVITAGDTLPLFSPLISSIEPGDRVQVRHREGYSTSREWWPTPEEPDRVFVFKELIQGWYVLDCRDGDEETDFPRDLYDIRRDPR